MAREYLRSVLIWVNLVTPAGMVTLRGLRSCVADPVSRPSWPYSLYPQL